MKSIMNVKVIALIALAGAALAAPVLAQPGPGMGGGWGGGPCMQGGGMRNGAGVGPGARAGWGNKGGRMMMANQDNVRGWTLLTPEERTSFQNRMRNVETYDECVQIQTEHRGMVEVRAKEKGVNLMTPMRNMCDNLKARGAIQ